MSSVDLPLPDGPDDRQEHVAVEREPHVIEEGAAVGQPNGEVDRLEGDLTGVDVLLERAVDVPQLVVTDPDHVELAHLGAADEATVDERAVVAADVDDLRGAARLHPELGVVARREEVVDHEIVVGRAADADDGGLGPVDLAERPGRRCRRDRGRQRRFECRFECAAAVELDERSGVGVAEAHRDRRGDLHALDAHTVHERAVARPQVNEYPCRLRAAQDGMAPRDELVVDPDRRVVTPADDGAVLVDEQIAAGHAGAQHPTDLLVH